MRQALTEKGNKGTFWSDGMFCIFIRICITQLYAFVSDMIYMLKCSQLKYTDVYHFEDRKNEMITGRVRDGWMGRYVKK